MKNIKAFVADEVIGQAWDDANIQIASSTKEEIWEHIKGHMREEVCWPLEDELLILENENDYKYNP